MSNVTHNLKTPKHIAFVSSASRESPGGAEAYQRFLGGGLSGYASVAGAARFHRGSPPMPNHAVQEAERTVGSDAFPTRIIASKPSWIPALRKLNHLVGRAPLQSLAIRIFTAAYGDSLRRALPKDLDLIHYVGVGWELLGFVALKEARRRSIPFCVTPFIHPGQWGDSALDARLYRQADAILTMSAYESNYLTKMGVAPSNLHLSGLAPASEFKGDGERFRRKYGLADRPLVLFIARKQNYKGFHALCAAMGGITDKVPGTCLITIGPEGEPPYPRVPDGALLDLGPLYWSPEEQQLKADALAACDVYCMPSAAESFGIVYVEAWSYAKPIVAGTAPAVRELISEGYTGFCVEQQSDEIAAVLIRLLNCPDLRQTIGLRGHAIQQARYTWDEIVRRHLAAYSTAMAAIEAARTRIPAA